MSHLIPRGKTPLEKCKSHNKRVFEFLYSVVFFELPRPRVIYFLLFVSLGGRLREFLIPCLVWSDRVLQYCVTFILQYYTASTLQIFTRSALLPCSLLCVNWINTPHFTHSYNRGKIERNETLYVKSLKKFTQNLSWTGLDPATHPLSEGFHYPF